jgi:hypothetical protein
MVHVMRSLIDSLVITAFKFYNFHEIFRFYDESRSCVWMTSSPQIETFMINLQVSQCRKPLHVGSKNFLWREFTKVSRRSQQVKRNHTSEF